MRNRSVGERRSGWFASVPVEDIALHVSHWLRQNVTLPEPVGEGTVSEEPSMSGRLATAHEKGENGAGYPWSKIGATLVLEARRRV